MEALLQVREIENVRLVTPLLIIPSLLCVWFFSNSRLQKLSLAMYDPYARTSLSHRIENVSNFERSCPEVVKIIPSLSPSFTTPLVLLINGQTVSSVGPDLKMLSAGIV